jgi:hypothetical protein
MIGTGERCQRDLETRREDAGDGGFFGLSLGQRLPQVGREVFVNDLSRRGVKAFDPAGLVAVNFRAAAIAMRGPGLY